MAVLLPCFVVKQLLHSLAKAFKRVNPVSPIDLRDFGEKIALPWDWHIQPKKTLRYTERFLPPSKRFPSLLEIAKVACGRVKSPVNHKRQKLLKMQKSCTLGKM